MRVVNILKQLKYFPGLKPLLLPIYIKISKQLRNLRFRIYGLRVMQEFDELMVDNGFHYSIFAGTLLGAIREGGPLKHDLDLDTIMFAKDYSINIEKVLVQNGFKLHHRFLVENGSIAREDTYIKHGVTIDIYYAYSDNRFNTYQCDFPGDPEMNNRQAMQKNGFIKVRRIEFPISYGLRRIRFGSIMVNAIDNAEEWLKCRYGKDYMIPNPYFRDKGDNPHIFEWEGVKGTLILYDE